LISVTNPSLKNTILLRCIFIYGHVILIEFNFI
jgi:hypothetical protein